MLTSLFHRVDEINFANFFVLSFFSAQRASTRILSAQFFNANIMLAFVFLDKFTKKNCLKEFLIDFVFL